MKTIEFKVGDRVKLIRPETEEEREEYPIWTKKMDRFDKQVYTITEIQNSGTVTVNDTLFRFKAKWLKSISKINLYI